MIDVSELMTDPDFSQSFTVYRSIGVPGPGGYQQAAQTLTLYGPTQPADAQTLDMVAEGDRVAGARLFWCTEPLYETNASGTSDVLIWQGQKFRITQIWPWQDGGFYKAFAVRMAGN